MAMTNLKFAGVAVAVLGIGVLLAAAPGLAQQPAPQPPNVANPPGPPGGDGPGMGPGGRMRGGDMGMGGMGMMQHPGQMCGEFVSRLAQRRMERIEHVVKPTDAQRQAFADLKTAASKAADIVRAACPTERFLTPTGRLESAEKRTEARLQAIRTVRPALENFYKSLSDEQKAHFNAIHAHHVPKWAGQWRERWHHAWQNFRDHDRGRWSDRGSNDRSNEHGGWRGRGGDRTGNLDNQGGQGGNDQGNVDGRGDHQGKLDQHDGDGQGNLNEHDGEYDKSAVEGEERM
jgi:LTXXQ motif family protein